MWSYFRGWKRKIGVLTLGLACVFMAGWAQSQSEHDYFNIEFFDGSWNHFASANGNLTWRTSTSEKVGVSAYTVAILWAPLPPEELQRQTQVVSSNAFSKTTKSSRLTTTEYVIPYWLMVIPLTLISAWCLLSKPRTKPATMPESSNA